MKTMISSVEVLGNIGNNISKLKKAFPEISTSKYFENSELYIKKMKELNGLSRGLKVGL